MKRNRGVIIHMLSETCLAFVLQGMRKADLMEINEFDNDVVIFGAPKWNRHELGCQRRWYECRDLVARSLPEFV